MTISILPHHVSSSLSSSPVPPTSSSIPRAPISSAPVPPPSLPAQALSPALPSTPSTLPLSPPAISSPPLISPASQLPLSPVAPSPVLSFEFPLSSSAAASPASEGHACSAHGGKSFSRLTVGPCTCLPPPLSLGCSLNARCSFEWLNSWLSAIFSSALAWQAHLPVLAVSLR